MIRDWTKCWSSKGPQQWRLPFQCVLLPWQTTFQVSFFPLIIQNLLCGFSLLRCLYPTKFRPSVYIKHYTDYVSLQNCRSCFSECFYALWPVTSRERSWLVILWSLSSPSRCPLWSRQQCFCLLSPDCHGDSFVFCRAGMSPGLCTKAFYWWEPCSCSVSHAELHQSQPLLPRGYAARLIIVWKSLYQLTRCIVCHPLFLCSHSALSSFLNLIKLCICCMETQPSLTSALV